MQYGREYDGAGAVVARHAQGAGIDEPLAMSRSGAPLFYNADGLGSVTSLADGTPTLTSTYVTDAFGKEIAATGAVANPFRYTGREWDAETGLYYYRARYYDSSRGRFLSEDPIKFLGGLNFYGYVGNSPSSHIDPSGLWSTEAHNQIIWNALHACGVSNADIWQIQQGSAFADRWAFQGGEWAFMHSMSNGNVHQSATAAQNQTAEFVASQMHDAVTVYNAGGMSQAMFIFGVAMHPVMDVTSPAHTDHNGSPIPWCGSDPTSCSNISDHVWPTSIEDLKHLNTHPEVQVIENFMIRNWFQALTGQKLNCCSN